VKVEITPVDLSDAAQLGLLMKLEAKSFSPSACFDEETWKGYMGCLIGCDDQSVGTMALGCDIAPGDTYDQDISSPGSLFLASINVQPESAGQGIASFALDWLANWAQMEGFRRIVSNFRPTNAASRHLHEKAGFTEVRRIPNFYKDPAEDAIEVEKIL